MEPRTECGRVPVRERGYPFVVQHTINGYSRMLETSVVDADRAIDSARRIHELFGSQVLVWRYDTIVISSETPPDFHVQNFDRLARGLRGATNEVVVSFAQIYRKTKRNMDAAAAAAGYTA